MSSEHALTQREFDTWREEDAAFKIELRSHIAAQALVNLDVEGRVSTIEANVVKAEMSGSRRTTWLSAIVSAIVSGLVGLFVGWRS